MLPLLEKKLQGLKDFPPAVVRLLSASVPIEAMPADFLSAYRAESLKEIVRRAYERSTFYKCKMDKAGVRPDEIRDLSDLEKVPLLTKDELRGKPWVLLACDKREVMLVQVSTGTTGGEEIYIPSTWNDYMIFDVAARYSKLFPVDSGDVCLNALPYEMSTAGLAFHRTLIEGYRATVIPAGKGGAYSTPVKTVKVISDLRPNLVITSPSWAVTLAEEASHSGFELRSLELKKIWLTGEGCSGALRRRLESLWGTKANFFYGSLECGMLGIECDEHGGYHIPEAHTIIEIVDTSTGSIVKQGEKGEIVVTTLLRYDTPLIRFRTGDMGSLDSSPCSCGVMLPRLNMRGREVDQIHYRGRSLSPVYLEEFLLSMPEIGNWFQFLVPASESANIKVRCELAEGVPNSSDLPAILAGRFELNTGLVLDFELLDRLPRTPGKATRVVRESQNSTNSEELT
jgi:phenylacetate-CoA ligase